MLQIDARSVSGRLHVYFQDMLDAAVDEAEGRPFAIINSDILLLQGRICRAVFPCYDKERLSVAQDSL